MNPLIWLKKLEVSTFLGRTSITSVIRRKRMIHRLGPGNIFLLKHKNTILLLWFSCNKKNAVTRVKVKSMIWIAKPMKSLLSRSIYMHASALEDSTETDEKQKGSNGMTDAKEHLSDTCNAFTAPEANARDATARIDDTEMLSSSFAPPENLMYSLHGTLEEGNELGKLGRCLVLVSLQDYSSSFGSCIINRDVFGDGLIQDLIKSKFIFLQLTIDSIEGQIYADRFHVRSFPHIGVIHPRHGSFIWGKEGWNENSPCDLCFERYSEDHFAMCIDSGTLDFFDLGDRDALLR
mmetsp:Transcript_17409/g.25709  ORF Transcript_17409/g.25709 Transcript_17409/m.25709 type:complete len:292 (-) Transcript_17409:596-1471(-)